MEPMTLGSPVSSPVSNSGAYLPSFLMGEPQAPTTPRTNTLSPNKGGRNLSFAATPGTSPPQDFNRSSVTQKTLFGSHHQSVANPSGVGNISNYGGTPLQSHHATSSGPPTQGLFDSLLNERNQVQSPTTRLTQPQMHYGTPDTRSQNLSAYGMNQSIQQHQLQQSHQVSPSPFHDSYLNSVSFNTSHVVSPPLGPSASNPVATFDNMANMLYTPPTPRYNDFWVTVYGFPPSAASTILQHFAQCGTIVDKVFPPQNGNWVHLKYSSRLECDKALNFNKKILSNNIMIGVTHCNEKAIVDKENGVENNVITCKIRPLAQTGYKSAQNNSSVVSTLSAPQKSSGLMNKAMDLFFGW